MIPYASGHATSQPLPRLHQLKFCPEGGIFRQPILRPSPRKLRVSTSVGVEPLVGEFGIEFLGPYLDGSGLARAFFTRTAVVGAAIC